MIVKWVQKIVKSVMSLNLCTLVFPGVLVMFSLYKGEIVAILLIVFSLQYNNKFIVVIITTIK